MMSENEDELNRLRISREKITFGKQLERQGYGSVSEGRFGDLPVVLKKVNVSYYGNVKGRLLDEILAISRFRAHPNLVALLGFCDEKSKSEVSHKIILVYEYVSGGNLDDKMRSHLTTIQCLEICLGAARGLDYLHTGVDASAPGIAHGNVTTSKILLTSYSNSKKFEAKVSGFGLSKILPAETQNVVEEKTAKLTKESDIYSFGVLLFEVLYGAPNGRVPDMVKKMLEHNNIRENVRFDIKTESLETYIKIARQCMLEIPKERPSMAQVVKELEKALRLQGGEVSSVQIVDSKIVDDNGVDNQSNVTPLSSESSNCDGTKKEITDDNTAIVTEGNSEIK